MLVLVALFQLIVRFMLTSSADVETVANGAASGDVARLVVNIFSALVGIVAIVLLVLFPLWLILFIKSEDGKRTRTTAIVLACFFGFWSWLYTYQRDRTKFWVNLSLSVVTVGYWGIVAWIWSIIDRASKPDDYYASYISAPDSKQN